jgi:hypothetical protein
MQIVHVTELQVQYRLPYEHPSRRLGTSGSRGFLYSDGKMKDLDTLLPSNSGWKSLVPRCINDGGQIAGVGVFTDGKPHIFLMAPNP